MNAVVLPEIKPPEQSIVPSPAAKSFVAQSLQTFKIQCEDFAFVVDNGATVYLIKPNLSKAQLRKCEIQASDISSLHIYLLAVQDFKFRIGTKEDSIIFVRPFSANPLDICSSGVLGLDFLHKLRPEISPTSHSRAK
jgi:hypothetical protein